MKYTIGANISRTAWQHGRLEWLAPPEDLLKAAYEEAFYKSDVALLNIQ